jgi:hypothetical protein
MAWLHDNGDENEFAQFEQEDESGEKEGLIEETEEEVIVTERPGAPMAPLAPREAGSKPKKKTAAKAKSAPKAKAKPKAKAARRAKAKPKKKAIKKIKKATRAAGKRGKRR